MKRIFIAVDISSEARITATEQITTLRREFPNVRVGWERPEKLHLTIKFIGDLEQERISVLELAMRRVAENCRGFGISIAGTGLFPSMSKPRILWLGVDDPARGLEKIYRNVEDGCYEAGIARETRDFKPHLTIGRVREPERSKSLAERHLETEFEPVSFPVSEIVIYESRLQPTGSVYSPLSKVSLTERESV